MKKSVATIMATALTAALSYAQGTTQSGQQGEGETWTERESLFLSTAVEKYAPESGFTPLANWTGEVWGNMSGGVKTGAVCDSLFTLGFEQEIESATKIKNSGSIGATAFYYVSSGSFTDDYLGSASDASNIFSGDMLRVFEIYYKNEFDTKAGILAMRLGQLASDEDFMGLDYADLFLNSSFGAIPTNAGDKLANGANAFSQYALATLGATLSFSRDNFEALLGVYNGDCGEDISTNNGFGYPLQSVAIWYQLAYNYKAFGLSGRVMFGGNYHNGGFADFSTDGVKSGFYSFYFGLQQDFLTDADGNAILGGFVRLACAPNSEIATYTRYVDAGLNWFAPIPFLPNDILGVGVSAMESSVDARSSAERAGEFIGRYETMAELTYRASLTKSISIQPSFQIYFNTRNAGGETRAAYVAGVRMEVNF